MSLFSFTLSIIALPPEPPVTTLATRNIRLSLVASIPLTYPMFALLTAPIVPIISALPILPLPCLKFIKLSLKILVYSSLYLRIANAVSSKELPVCASNLKSSETLCNSSVIKLGLVLWTFIFS